MNVQRIAGHELRQAWRSRALAPMSLTLTLLLAGSALAGAARYTADREQRVRFQSLVARQWANQPDRHPHRVSHYGFLLFRPRGPLAFFDSGVEAFTGVSIFLEAHRQNSANFADAAQANGARRFGDLTMAAVLQLFGPLLVFAWAGAAVSRERAGGTIWLALSQGVPWRTFATGTIAGSLAALACALGPGLLLAGGWLGTRMNAEWTADAARRAALLIAAHAAYLTACAAGAVVLAGRLRQARSAPAALVIVWIALWVVAPRTLPAVATWLYPLPSRAALEADVERGVRAVGDSHNPDDPKFRELRAAYLAKYGVSRLDDLPLNYNGVVSFEAERATSEAYRTARAALLEAYRRQQRVVEWGALFSPYVAIRLVSMALAGVDVAHASEFDRQAEGYRYALVQHLNTLHTTEVEYRHDRYEGVATGGAPTRQRIGQEHWQHAPTFAFKAPTARWAVQHAAYACWALAGWVVAASAALLLSRQPSA